jgi:hypothetical protein
MCLRISYKESDLDPDPVVRGTDPRIRTKMSRIPNTGYRVFVDIHNSEPLGWYLHLHYKATSHPLVYHRQSTHKSKKQSPNVPFFIKSRLIFDSGVSVSCKEIRKSLWLIC